MAPHPGGAPASAGPGGMPHALPQLALRQVTGANADIPFEVLIEDPSDPVLLVPHLDPYRDKWTLCGNGQYGAVYRWNVLGQDVAIKVASTAKGESAINSLRRERDHLLYLCPHPRIVQIFAHYRDPTRQDLHVVMEYIPTNLRDDDVVARSPLAEVFSMLAEGLDYMHSHGVCHRDVKGRNVLCAPSSAEPSGWCVKVIDFGLACNLHTDSAEWVRRRVGDRKYRAPETALAVGGSMSYAPSADVYSFGATIAFTLDQRTRLDASRAAEALTVQKRREEAMRTPLIAIPPTTYSRMANLDSAASSRSNSSSHSQMPNVGSGHRLSLPAMMSPPGSPTMRHSPSMLRRLSQDTDQHADMPRPQSNNSMHSLDSAGASSRDKHSRMASPPAQAARFSRLSMESPPTRFSPTARRVDSSGNLLTMSPHRPKQRRQCLATPAGEMLVAVGEACVQLDPEARPSMKTVIDLLSDLPDDDLPSPPRHGLSPESAATGGGSLPTIAGSPSPAAMEVDEEALQDTTARLRAVVRSVRSNRVGETVRAGRSTR